MLSYVFRRILYMVPTLLAVTIVSFGVIVVYEVVNGSFADRLRLNPTLSPTEIERITDDLALNEPYYVRYGLWIQGIFISTHARMPETSEKWKVWSIGHLNLLGASIPYPKWRPYFGESFQQRRPVSDLFLEYLPLTLLMTIPVFIFVWLVSLPIGIYSATHQYSIGDHAVTFFGFIGLSIPNFFLALLILYFLAVIVDVGSICFELASGPHCLSVGGIFSVEFTGGSPWPWNWSFNKFLDYSWHMIPVVIVLGTSAMATLIRIMRGSMLDILGSNYVKTARSKGLSERFVIYKHAVRNAVNPLVSVFGQFLPFLIQGALVTAIVLSIPTVDYLFFQSLFNADIYLVVTILTFYATVLLVGNLISDILLALVDPRIRYE